VPFLVISPYARAGYVDHHTYSFPSIVKSVEELEGVGSLTAYDREATDVWGAFDFAQKPLAPLALTQRGCASVLSMADYRKDLPAAVEQDLTWTLGLSRAQLLARHQQQTLAQIMVAQGVPQTQIEGNLWYTVTSLTNAMTQQHLLSRAAATATVNQYLQALQRLQTAPPGTSLAPLLTAQAPPVQLPHATSFPCNARPCPSTLRPSG
jgi:hypothetical protein